MSVTSTDSHARSYDHRAVAGAIAAAASGGRDSPAGWPGCWPAAPPASAPRPWRAGRRRKPRRAARPARPDWAGESVPPETPAVLDALQLAGPRFCLAGLPDIRAALTAAIDGAAPPDCCPDCTAAAGWCGPHQKRAAQAVRWQELLGRLGGTADAGA
jgi:hypothetical protein